MKFDGYSHQSQPIFNFPYDGNTEYINEEMRCYFNLGEYPWIGVIEYLPNYKRGQMCLINDASASSFFSYLADEGVGSRNRIT